MALYLVQHGKSLSREAGPDPGLSEEGIAETERIAGVAEGYGVRVAVIRHSAKARARETAERRRETASRVVDSRERLPAAGPQGSQ